MSEWAQQVFEKIDLKLQAECNRMGDKIPYIAQNGRYMQDMRQENLSWWTNGFWAGMLWQMYHATRNPLYQQQAQKTEIEFDNALQSFEGLHHDVGFMWLHSAVANYRLTQNPQSRVRGLHAATLLAGRYNPIGKFIRAWNADKAGWMIVDCLMNIPLLYWAQRETQDNRFGYIAQQHADTAMQALLREDGSCNHIAIFNLESGQAEEFPAGQGYAEGSAWSRGQAWAVYGFALSALHTGKESYLSAAKKAAHYFVANVAQTDWVSLVDFRAPSQPEQWDTTATACAACGLLQIAQLVPSLEKPLYENSAKKMLQALEKSYCNWNTQEDGILNFGTAAYHRVEDTHVPIIYGDYFFVEGVLRLLDKDFLIW